MSKLFCHPVSVSIKKIRSTLTTPAGAAVAIFIAAALLRLCLLNVAYYSAVGELYRDMEVIWNMFHFGRWPLLGPSSALGGFYFGAFYYYIEGLFVFLFRFVPYGAVFSSTFFSLLSLPLLYLLCRKWFINPWVATLAVGIQSVALFDIQNSYYVSNPNFLPAFFLAMCLVLTYLSERPQIWHYAALGLILGVATQLHATALVLMPVMVAAVVWKYKIRPRWWEAALVLLLWAACFAPYIIYEFTHNFELVRALLAITHKETASGNRWLVFLGFLNFFGSFFIFKDGAFNFYPGFASAFLAAVALAGILIAAAVWISWRRHFRPSQGMLRPIGKTMMLVWFWGGLLMYLISAVPPAYYYYIIMWPLPVLLAAWWLGSLSQVSKKDFVLLLSGYMALQLFCAGVFFVDIYQPEYSYADIQRVMATIKTAGAGKDYLIVNQALDINQFLYYLRLNGLRAQSRHGASHYIYFNLVDCPAGGGVALGPVLHPGNLCVQQKQK